jgi:hypothetical protein
VVAVAEVGVVPGGSASLTVSWFQLQPNGAERALFTHRLHVATGDHVYSVGASTGRFAVGLYLVVASLGGARLQTPFMVSEPTFVLTAAGSGSSVGEGGPPLSGSSGVVSPPTPAPAASGGCQLGITGDASSTVYIDVTSCAGDTVEVSVDVDGHDKVLGTFAAADALLPYGGNPCIADPTLGFDPVPIIYTATIVKGSDRGTSASITGTTAAVTTPPPGLVLASSSPQDGAQVVPGQGISMTFQAKSDVGIQSIIVTRSPGGGVVADQHFAQGAKPTRCNPNRNLESAIATDTVPADPPPVLSYTTVARDFAGRTTTLTIEFPTETVWVGVAFGPGIGLPTADYCAANWNISPIFVAVSPKKGLSGSADASTPGIVSCPEPVADYAHGRNQGSITLGVRGTYDGTTFRLQFQPGVVTGALGNGSIEVLLRPTPATVVVSRTGDKQAEGTFDLTEACPGVSATICSWHLTLQISLTCCFPYAGPIAPPPQILSPPIYIP